MKVVRLSRETFLLFAILTLALALRIWAVHFGLPFLYHADEPIVVNHALAYGSGDLNPHFFKIPPLVSYLLFVCYGLFFILGKGIGFFHTVRDFEQLFYFDPTLFYLIARIIFGVFAGTISVYILYRLVKRFWNVEAGLWAAFFLAINFLHARDSHYIYADIPLVLTLLLGFSVIFKIPQNPVSWKRHVFVGVLIGLSAAVKYNGIFLAMPYAWICFRTIPWRKWLPCWALASMAAVFVFLALNPYSIFDSSFFLREITEQSQANSGVPWFHHLTYSLGGALGWPLLLISLLGMIGSFFVRDPRQEAVSIFVVGYYLVLCHWGQSYDRYVLPLIPLMLFAASQVLLKLKIWSRPLFVFLILVVVLPPLIKIVAWDQLMTAKDMRTLVREWVEDNIPNGSRIAMSHDFFMPRLAFSTKQLEEKKALAQKQLQARSKIRRVDALLAKGHEPSYEQYFLSPDPQTPRFLFGEPQIPFDMRVLKQKNVEYVLVVEPLHAAGDLFFSELQNHATRLVSFSPYRNKISTRIYDAQSLTGGPFLWKDIAARERNGYPIAVYKLRD